MSSKAFAASWARGVEATPLANAARNPDVSLPSVSCASAGNCSAVGYYDDGSGYQQALLLTESGGTWAAGVEATLPANAAIRFLSSVSCASAGNCSAVGTYFDCSGNLQGLLLSESGGTWAAGVEATLPANAVPADAGCQVVLSRLRVSPKTFVLAGRRVNGRCVKQTAKNRTHQPCTRPVKLSVSYQLNILARVTITIKRAVPGRLSKRRCVAPTRNNRTHRRCTRLLTLRGSLTKNGAQGSNTVTFNGRIGGHKLAPGTYQLTATPSFGGAQTVTFRIAS
jgi:hypothetical protein